MSYITKQDKVIAEAIEREFQRQNSNIELIASENFVSEAVMEAQGSVLTKWLLSFTSEHGCLLSCIRNGRHSFRYEFESWWSLDTWSAC